MRFPPTSTLVVRIFMCLLGLLSHVSAGGSRIIKYDAPNSGTGPGQGTTSTGINVVGTITGYVTDNNNGTHGFVQSPAGQFKGFDAPGADPGRGVHVPSQHQ